MKTNAIIIFFILLIAQIYVSAAEIVIVDVRRNITLSDDDAVYKDFYLEAGEGSGLKKNLVVNVKRKIYVRDQAAKSIGDFETVVGQLRIVHVQGKIAVGREYKLQSRDEEAMVEQIGIMSGDHIDLTGSFVDSARPKRKPAEIPASAEGAGSAVLPLELLKDVKNPLILEGIGENDRAPAKQLSISPQAIPEI